MTPSFEFHGELCFVTPSITIQELVCECCGALGRWGIAVSWGSRTLGIGFFDKHDGEALP